MVFFVKISFWSQYFELYLILVLTNLKFYSSIYLFGHRNCIGKKCSVLKKIHVWIELNKLELVLKFDSIMAVFD